MLDLCILHRNIILYVQRLDSTANRKLPFMTELVKFIDKCLAPGTYHPEKMRMDKAPQFTFGLRTSLDKPSDTPGI